MSKSKIIEAAGCVVFRRHNNVAEFLLEHRPRYDDWSFPKGKKDKGETDFDCAIREVQEETGALGNVLAELPTVRYRIGGDKEKVVRYWIMEYLGGEFIPNKEVDKIAWLDRKSTAETLTYSHDINLLKETIKRIQ